LRTRPQNILSLIAVTALAAALTLAASGGALARSTFQSSIIPLPESTGTAPPTPDFTPGGSDATPSVSGFLPPPTLVNPSSVAPGRVSPLAPENQPLVGAAAPPEATSTPTPAEAPGVAQLIDSGVVALSYLWLCCGALFLVAAALTIVWLSRRSKRR
jgi:hypothetical protein